MCGWCDSVVCDCKVVHGVSYPAIDGAGYEETIYGSCDFIRPVTILLRLLPATVYQSFYNHIAKLILPIVNLHSVFAGLSYHM